MCVYYHGRLGIYYENYVLITMETCANVKSTLKWKLHVYDYKIQLRCISLTSAVVIKKFWHTQEAAWSPYNHAIGCVNITTPIFCHIDFSEFKFYFTLRIGVIVVCMIFFFPSSKFYKIWYKKKLILLNFGYTHMYLSLCVISVQNIFL